MAEPKRVEPIKASKQINHMTQSQAERLADLEGSVRP